MHYPACSHIVCDSAYLHIVILRGYMQHVLTCFCEVRMQVHVVLMTQGHDPVLVRTLQETASSLSWLTAVYSPAAKPLLPETAKLGSEDPGLQQQPVRVVGGALTSTNQGLMAQHALHVAADLLQCCAASLQPHATYPCDSLSCARSEQQLPVSCVQCRSGPSYLQTCVVWNPNTGWS